MNAFPNVPRDARILTTDTLLGSPSFITERRDSRMFVEVALDFRLSDGGKIFQGVKLSRRMLTVRWRPGQRQPKVSGEASLAADAKRKVTLHIPLSGFELALDLEAMPMIDGTTKDGLLRYKIAEGDARAQVLLAQLVRVVLTGVLPGVDDLMQGHDDETPLPFAPVSEPPARPRLVPVALLSASLVALCLGVIVFGFNIWRATTTLTTAATIVAPRTDIISLDYGRASELPVIPNAMVRKNDLLIGLEFPQIEAEIRATEARIAGSARTARTHERRLLAALTKRQRSLRYLSPCDCTVQWALDAGSTVSPGTRMMTLVKTNPADLRVLARIPADREQEIRSGQAATVRLAGQSSEIGARVAQVGSDADTLPFMRQGSATLDRIGWIPVLLKLDPHSQAVLPGTKAEVVIHK